MHLINCTGILTRYMSLQFDYIMNNWWIIKQHGIEYNSFVAEHMLLEHAKL